MFFSVIALQVGKAVGKENDGCLLSIGNLVLTLLGGALGFLAFMQFYPAFLLTSMVGALLLPSLATWSFTRRARRGR